jgi:hypothetical protein
MNTRSVNVKRASTLRIGDIVDSRTFGFMYGFKYYRVTHEPVQCKAHPEIFNIRLAVIHVRPEELKRDEPLQCTVRANGDADVRVCLRMPPRQLPSYDTRYFNKY